ncbi:MAG TPA: hypothetical protein VK633_03670, partial [Verrucomicrobiae bacterium]|nr:hypothetical protein [Verrucomicrobiae bacterium]
MPGPQPTTEADRSALLRTHYALQQGYFISERSEIAGGIAAFSAATPVPMWNHAAWIGGEVGEFRSFLELSSAWEARRGRRPVVYVAEPSASEFQALREKGYEKFDEEAWMAAHDAAGQKSVRVTEVKSEA